MFTLIKIVAVVAVIGALTYAAEHWCNAVCRDATAERDTLRAAVAAAKANYINQVALWDDQRKRADQAEEANEHARDVLLRTMVDSARRLPGDIGRGVFPAAAVGVLNDAIRTGESTLAPAADAPDQAAPAAAADSTVGAVTEWGVTCIAYYDAALDRVDKIIAYYDSLRASQPKEAP